MRGLLALLGAARRLYPRTLLALALLAAALAGGAGAGWRGALQEYLHPGLRLLRRLSLPLLAFFPALNELYDETCLIHNPFFRIVDMDCWPCSSADSVLETGFPEKMVQEQDSVPFVYKTNQQSLNLSILEEMYKKNKEVFNRDAFKITVNDKENISPKEMFDVFSKDDYRLTHKYYLWRINRISPAQIIRKLIPRPKIVPRFGQSTERFILIDLSSNSFQLPDPECNFVFLLQIKGDRMIQLQPAKECAGQCKPLTVLLKESYLSAKHVDNMFSFIMHVYQSYFNQVVCLSCLMPNMNLAMTSSVWYNWWYWRPILQSSVMNETSIAHMGSYC